VGGGRGRQAGAPSGLSSTSTREHPALVPRTCPRPPERNLAGPWVSAVFSSLLLYHCLELQVFSPVFLYCTKKVDALHSVFLSLSLLNSGALEIFPEKSFNLLLHE
jgi:hypothetical protein